MKRIDTDIFTQSESKIEVFGVDRDRSELLYSHVQDLIDGSRTYSELLIDILDVCDTLEEQFLCVSMIESLIVSMQEGLGSLVILRDQPDPIMALPLEIDAMNRALAIVSEPDQSDTDVVIKLRDKSHSIQEFTFGVIALCKPKINMG